MPSGKDRAASSTARSRSASTQKAKDDDKAGVLAGLLYDQAALSAGRMLDNPAQFVQELNRMMFDKK